MKPFERSLVIIGCCGGVVLAIYGAITGNPWWMLGLLILLFGAIILWTTRRKS
jgi:hypothetical protein